jgi:hypothetical protein
MCGMTFEGKSRRILVMAIAGAAVPAPKREPSEPVPQPEAVARP